MMIILYLMMAGLCLLVAIVSLPIMVWEVITWLSWKVLLVSLIMASITCIGVRANIAICLRIAGSLCMKGAVFVLPRSSLYNIIPTRGVALRLHTARVQIATFLWRRATILYGRIWETTHN